MGTGGASDSAGLPRRFPDSDSRQFSVRKIQGDRIFLRPSAEPFLESDGSRVRGRGAADRGREEGVSAPESYRCLGCDRVLRHHRLERCEHPRCCAESAAGHSGMRRYPADLLQRGDRVEVLPEVPGEAAGTGSGSPSVDESRERRMVYGAAAWRVEPVRRSLTKRRVTG